MPKLPQQSPEGPEYSREREFKVILEDLHSRFKVFGEGQEDLGRRVGRVEQKLDGIESDVSQIKSFLRPLIAEVSDHTRRLTVLEKNR